MFRSCLLRFIFFGFGYENSLTLLGQVFKEREVETALTENTETVSSRAGV